MLNNDGMLPPHKNNKKAEALLTGSTLFVRIFYDEGSEEEEEKDGLTTP